MVQKGKVWGYVSASTAFHVKTMSAIKGIRHPFWGHSFSAQQVFECWGFLHKRHPFWGPLNIHKIGHPTAITCKIITDLDLHFACEATRTRSFFKMKSFTPCSMEEKSSSWSKSASPSEWWPHWCQSQTKTQKFVWPLCVTPIFQGSPQHAPAKGTVPLLRRTWDAPRNCRASGWNGFSCTKLMHVWTSD